MSAKPNVCVLMAAYNEEGRIAATMNALRSRPVIDRIVVIDDGSTDHTASVAKDAGASQVISLVRNQGKGAALAEGFKQAKESGEIFLLLDADLGASATECLKLLPPIINGEADMTIGLLPPDPELAYSNKKGGGMGFVVRLARWGLQKKTGLLLLQPLSGQRAVRREVLEALGGRFSAGFGVEVGLTLRAAQRGCRICEVETAFRHRVTGGDWRDLAHRGRQFVDVAQALLQSGARS